MATAARDIRYIDIHSHGHEYGAEKLRSLHQEYGLLIFVVSEDLETANKVLQIAREAPGVVPCLGVHPWTVNEVGLEKALQMAREVLDLALENKVRCIGEVGLDTKFVPESIEAQRQVFRLFLEAARDNNLYLNLHTAGTWEEVLSLLQRYDAPAANFHWYTGPPHLLRVIDELGYTISINPAVRIQRKHQEIVRQAPLEMMLTESDAPYEYRGMRLDPSMIPEVVEHIARIKGLEPEDVRKNILQVFRKRVAPVVGL